MSHSRKDQGNSCAAAIGLTIALTFGAATPVAFAAGSQPAGADETALGMIVLTDGAAQPEPAVAAMKGGEGADRRAAVRQEILDDISKQRLEMDANGHVVGSEEIMSGMDRYPEELQKHQATKGETFASVSADFAYAARNLEETPFGEGRLLGFMAIRAEDQQIHETVWAYEIRGIGTVIVEELSYRTIPDVTIKVAEPSGNIRVNGVPGTYMVMVDKKKKRGVTTIEFITADKLFTLTAFAPIKRDNKQFARLETLASSLY